MPSGSRVRANNCFGTVVSNPLTAGATSFTSVELALLPEVVSAHAVLTLDPLRQNGEPEIIIVTAHGPGSQTATILRGKYGTIARQHPQGTVWVHAPVDEDVTKIATSATRPLDPYEGQIIYETDTQRFVGRVAGAWRDFIPAGVMSAFGADTPPTGWLLCDGAPVSRTTYADLFATIGVSYGVGNGTTTFNLPNLSDRVPVGKGGAFPTLGATGGSKDAVVVSHNHNQDSHGHTQNAHNHLQDSHGHTSDDNWIGTHDHASEINQFVITHNAGPFRVGDDVGTSYQFVTFTPTTADSGGHHHDITVSGTTAVNQGTTATNQGATAVNQASGVSGTNANMPLYQIVRWIIKY